MTTTSSWQKPTNNMLDIIPTQLKAGLLIAAIFLAFVTGWQVHSWKVASDHQESTKTAINESVKDTEKSGEIIAKAESNLGKEEIVYRTIYKENRHVQDADHVCFSNESLSLWNRAIAGSDSDRPKPDATPGTAEPATATEQTATVEDVLTSGAENFQTCRKNAIRHNALIDKIESLAGKMCYCQE